MTRFGSSVKKEKDETPFLEVALRGYDLSKLKDDDETTNTPESLKIGSQTDTEVENRQEEIPC